MALPTEYRELDLDELNIRKSNGYRGRYLQATLTLDGDRAATSQNWQCRFFTADRNFEIVRVTEIHTSAASGTANVDVKAIANGDNPSSGGRSVLASATTINLASTASTLQDASLTNTYSNRILKRNETLACLSSGDVNGMTSVCLTVFLKAI